MFLRINDNWSVNIDQVVATEFTDLEQNGSVITLHLADSRQVNITFTDESALELKTILSDAENLENLGDRTKIRFETQIAAIIATGTVQVLPP
jgi:hypothetical protein